MTASKSAAAICYTSSILLQIIIAGFFINVCFLIHLFFTVVFLLSAQSTINNMAVSGQIRSKENCNVVGFIMANTTKATSAMMPPVNSHFHASPSPIRPIPATDNCKILLALIGSEDGESNDSPININKENTIMRPLNPRRIQRNSLYDLVLIVFLSLVLSYMYGFSVSPRFL